ncbi:MAG: MFS transporter [Ancalomicrobiaceae bacterium]|nr:MFS transporter [Ancalomicrobiaceae bacterium]
MRRDGVTWVSYLSLALFTFFLNIQGNILPFLRDAFGLNYRWVTFHPAALAVGLILSGLIGERVIAAVGRRHTISIGLLGLVVGALLIVVATAPVVSIAGCFVMGLVGGCVLVTVPGLLVQWHRDSSSAALGEANAFSYAASLLAALSTSFFLAVGIGWRGGLLLGAVLVVALLVFARSLPLPEQAPAGAAARGGLPMAFWFHWLALVGVVGVEQSTLVWAPAFLEGVKDASRSIAATGGAVFSAGMLIGRMSSVPLLSRIRTMTALYGSFGLLVPAFGLYWVAQSPVLYFPGLFLLGLGTALLYPLTLALAIDQSGPHGNTASARASLASGVAVLAFPVLVGTLADNFGLQIALTVLPVVGAISLACLLIGHSLGRAETTPRAGGR